MPKGAWPADGTEPLARALVASLRELPPDRRADPAGLDAVQLAERLAESLPEENRRAIRRELRALGVQVIRIEAVPEEMLFDVKWFAVEAGKPVQIVLYNPDAMSHNLLVIKPGTLEEVGTKASTMPVPSDPAVKPYVPDTPSVLQATRLLNFGENDRLSFTAPGTPGEYPFACTFPGHWVRMYGVMLVVENMEAWEATPSVPKDPMTNQPYTSPRK
jgi:azurin